jgi:hypothetical protein
MCFVFLSLCHPIFCNCVFASLSRNTFHRYVYHLPYTRANNVPQQRLHRIHHPPASPGRHIQLPRPDLRQPSRCNLEFHRNQRRHYLLVPPTSPTPLDSLPTRRIHVAQPQQPRGTTPLCDHPRHTRSTIKDGRIHHDGQAFAYIEQRHRKRYTGRHGHLCQG